MSILKKIWMNAGYVYDSRLDVMFGEKNGFKFAVQSHGQNQYSLMFSVKRDQGAVEKLEAKVLKQSATTVSVASFKQYKLTCSIKPGLTAKKTGENILQAIDEVVAFLEQNGYVQCCEASGETADINLYIVGNQLSFLTPASYSQRSQELDQSEQAILQTKENIFLGILGAFLGSLVGVAAIVIIGQLGYVSYVSGVVMGVCALKGYELLARRLSVKGAVISVILILAMTYFANQLDWAFTVARYYEISVFDTLPYINDLVAEGIIDNSVYVTNLVLIYASTVISALAMIITTLKAHKTKFEVRKLF
ncbi:hypothetical protein [Streptococcus oriscaviae]|uniref:Uncharacterized protein n=1 Tax=Streptococcus oriscaviae TaxID=2781599 RepID=A0ABX7YLM8_9STRE|nr:hypothetical protein [Streptococcus oriscaviae]QUE54746.1 hypothetical protein INT76_02340 [Streptococcus oriscaviae]